MKKHRSQDKLLKIYTISVILAFGLLFYANAEAQEAPDGTVVHLGLGKSFYAPCALALMCSFFIKRKYDAIEATLYGLILLTIISTLIHPPFSSNVLEWTTTRFIFAILCFRDLRNVSPVVFIKYLSIASPLIVLPHYVLSDPFSFGVYRYGGFYGDANFLALALNFIIVICYLSIKMNKRQWIRLCALTSIFGSIPLILVGMSRGGLLGLFLIMLFIMTDSFKKNKKAIVLLSILLLVALYPIFLEIEGVFGQIEERFTEGNANARIEGIVSAINVLTNKPELIPFGIGPGNTVHMMSYYKQFGYICAYVIHNTFFSILYEMGIFACILYVSLYIRTFYRLHRQRHFLLMGLLLSSALSLFTLPGHAFMPGWILLFFLSNHRIYLAYGSK